MIGKELPKEVLANSLARGSLGGGGERVCHKAQVFLKRFCAVGSHKELFKARNDVIGEVHIFRNGKHIVSV